MTLRTFPSLTILVPVLVLAAALAALVAGNTAAGDSAGDTAGADAATELASVAGSVQVDSRRPAGKIVVYLEPADPDTPVPVPDRPLVMSQVDASFVPDFAVLSLGQTLRLLNNEQDQIDHNAYSYSPSLRFDLGLFGPGQSRDVVMETAGEVSMFCSIHKYMEASIYVCPAPWFAVLDGPGEYRIEGVPPGEYKLRTWQTNKRLKNREEAVRLEAGGEARVDFSLSRN